MRKKSLKIAIFHLAFIYSGGGEKLVLEEAEGLKELGHEVTIFTPVINREKCFPDIIDKFEIKTLLPQFPFIVPEHESAQILITCILAPLLALRFRSFDVILAANQPSPWIAWWVKNFFGIPYVSYLAQPTRFLHPRKIDQKTGLTFSKKASVSLSAKLMHRGKRFISWADRVSIKGSNRILANGEYIKKLLEKTYSIKALSCPAGAHPRQGVSFEKRLKKPYLLITNRHFAQKRFEYAIFALSSVLEKFPDYSLKITGAETGYTDELKVLIGRLNLNSRVEFLGYVKEKDLEKLYSEAVVYLYTAPEEDFGMGIVEALGFGTPVVAWNKAGPARIVKDGKTGLLAKPFVASDFSKKCLRIVSDKTLAKRLGSTGLKEVKRNFSSKNHIIILEEALKDVL